MSNTINNSIPFVPENTIDPAAGLNISLNAIDAMLQVLVLTVGANTPPVGVEGARHIVGTAPTGAWDGQANKLARFLNGVWVFYDARYVLNTEDGGIYVRSGSVWTLFSPPISDNSVTNAKLADVATKTIKGRTTAGTGDPEDLTAAQARTVMGLATTDSPTFNALTLTNGQIVFPATQVPSANANTLDDYEEGTWTPVVTFATQGDLSVTYSSRTGTYNKTGNKVHMHGTVVTSGFTHTTASGNFQVTGAPFTGAFTDNGIGEFSMGGWTANGYTDTACRLASGTTIDTIVTGSGLAIAQLNTARVPSGASINMRLGLTYFT